MNAYLLIKSDDYKLTYSLNIVMFITKLFQWFCENNWLIIWL